MIRLLESAARASSSHTAVVTPEGSFTYGELLDNARRVASALARGKIARFAIIERDAAAVIALLAGAALAGAEPCQYQADIASPDFAKQAKAVDHAIVVSRRSDLGGTLEVISPEELTAQAPEKIPPAADAQAILIRTTGTTGAPKAARYDWALLGRTVAGVTPRPDQRWLLAYGPHQFAGIQVLQHVLACHATLIAPFPRQPRDGLRALLHDRVTCVSATPTYWRFLLAQARSVGVELPPLEQVTLGGEASPADLLEELQTAFPCANISHVYASTEFGSITSVRDGRPGFAVDALFSENNPSSKLRVIDDELWVRAPAGMLGYAGESGGAPAAVSEPAVSTDWRPTGDLVEIVGERVVFRGRSSEVINVGGVKVHPLPIEDKITALDGVAAARVFGRPNPLTGAIVAAEVVPIGGVEDADYDAIRREISSAVADLPRAWHPRSVRFVEAIETRGQKTVRGLEA